MRKLHESASDPKYNAVKTSRSKIFEDDEDTPDDDELGGDLAKFAILTGPADYDEDEDEMSEDEEMENKAAEQEEEEEGEEAYQPSRPFGEVQEDSEDPQSEDEDVEEKEQMVRMKPQKVHKEVNEVEDDRQLAEALRKTREQDRAKGKAVAKQLVRKDRPTIEIVPNVVCHTSLGNMGHPLRRPHTVTEVRRCSKSSSLGGWGR